MQSIIAIWGSKIVVNIILWISAPKFTKFGTELPQLLKNPNKHKYLEQIFYKWEKNPKNLLGVFTQVKIGLKKSFRQKKLFA